MTHAKALLFAAGSVAIMGIGLASSDGALERARERLSKLTLEEKASLVGGSGTMTLGTVERAGITNEWTFSDNSHTIRPRLKRWTWDHEESSEADKATVLPSMGALAATWNKDLAQMHGEVMGEEARARGVDQILGPGINIMRTPLCGRNWEYLSEDPYLAGEMAKKIVTGIQSRDVAATVKHFALNNQELDRHWVNVLVDERALNEIYLAAFRAAIVEAGSYGIMSAYNKYNGEWCSENDYLQRAILRDRWHFPGTIVTDWGGQHSTVRAALNGAGIEMNRGDDIRYFRNPDDKEFPIAEEVKKSNILEKTLDDMALRTLWVMEKTKFFEPEKRFKGEVDSLAHRKKALEIAEEAIILLKNDAGILPLDKKETKRILLIGKLANSEVCRNGWSAEGNPPYEITPLRGIAEYLGARADIITAPLIAGDEEIASFHPIEAAMETYDENARDAGMSIKAWKAEFWRGGEIKGAPVATGAIRRLDTVWATSPANGVELDNFSARFTTSLRADETGNYQLEVICPKGSGIRLFVNGKKLANNWDGEDGEKIRERFKMKAGKSYRIVVEYRSCGGAAFCRFGWIPPSFTSMDLNQVREEAEKADAVILFTGTEIGHGQALECEGEDRPNMRLADGHDKAIENILSWNLGKLVIVNRSGAPMELGWIDKADTFLQMPYLGQEAGRALAKILFGDINPSGRLPYTWPKRYEDTAVAKLGEYKKSQVAYNESIYVGYRWFDKEAIEPLFPFGYGLGFTKIEYGEMEVARGVGKAQEETFTITLQLANAGKIGGKEVVELYVACPSSKVERAPKELKGFDKVYVAPYDSASAKITISARDLAYFDSFLHVWRTEPGRYKILLGPNSEDIRVEGEVEIEKEYFFEN